MDDYISRATVAFLRYEFAEEDMGRWGVSANGTKTPNQFMKIRSAVILDLCPVDVELTLPKKEGEPN